MEQTVYLYTDGACKGNPGAGGWGVLLRYGRHEKELFGGEAETTNNRMELTAVIEGLKALKRTSCVEICTDSQYVKNGMQSWIHGWKKNGWKTSAKQPVKNEDLWRELDRLAAARFGAHYRPDSGLIRYPESQGHLKSEWLNEKTAANPEAAYFRSRNPRHAEGDELVCLTLLAPENLRSFALRGFLAGLQRGAL